MKLCFKNAFETVPGIRYLMPELGFCIADEKTADAVVNVIVTEEDVLSVTLKGSRAAICYGGGKARFFRGLAALCSWIRRGETEKTLFETPSFKTNGAMLDMSRNAVMNTDSVKLMLRRMAMMGLNTFMLYTEDTYEIGNRPYFGYMRGRYTPDELVELDAYALELGIELIPCVQMLGHLKTHLQWKAAEPYKDTEWVLLAGEEETYKLIDDMLKTISRCFTTRRIHIGMDEAGSMGTGKYLRLNGYRDRREIFFEHLSKVRQMCEKYGFEPMMWSDMFFRMAGEKLPGYNDYDTRAEFDEKTVSLVPQGIRQVFWDYYHADKEFYDINIDKHIKYLGGKPVFAGGIWLWSGHCPFYDLSLKNSLPALRSCREKGVDEVIATVWLNGGEAAFVMSLAGLAWYASFDYRGEYDESDVRETFERACMADYDSLMEFQKPAFPHGGEAGAVWAMLYNDPLMGLADKNLEGSIDNGGEYFRTLTPQLERAAQQQGIFASAQKVIVALCDLLENKCDFGLRLKKAYDRGDRDTLKAMEKECSTVIRKIKKLRDAHRKAWMEHNKPMGWEIMDIRYGGLISRFETTKERIGRYLSGELKNIGELEQERLPIGAQPAEGVMPGIGREFLWYKYGKITTANTL